MQEYPSTGAHDDARNARHRHFLGVPVFALLLGMTLWTGGEQLYSGVLLSDIPLGTIAASGADRAFSLPRGISGMLREDGVLRDDGDELSLEEGTALLQSTGLVRLRSGNVVIEGFHGGFLASKTADKLSLYALTTPVLLRRDEHRIIVPVGLSGEWQESALPVVFNLTAAAEERGELRLLDAGVARDQLRALADLPSMQPRVSAQTGRASETAALLLASAAQRPSAAAELLADTPDVDLWLLASFHPDFLLAAWETPGPLAMPKEPRLLRWLLLPSSDVGKAHPGRSVERWTAQLRKHLDDTTPSARLEMLHALLTTMRGYRPFIDGSEFPERLQRTAGALQQVIGPWTAELSPDDQKFFAAWNTIDAIASYSEPAPLPPDPLPASTVSSSSGESLAPEEPFDHAAIEARVKQLLLGAGALFTTQTQLSAESATRVRVSHLVFASSTGESQYRFLLDLAKNEAQGIERDGKPQPYPLSLEALGKWAKSGR